VMSAGLAPERVALRRRLHLLLAALASDCPSVIVVDAGVPSGEAFDELQRGMPECWAFRSRLDGVKPSRSSAFNEGARYALQRGAEYLCFVDADVPFSAELPDIVLAARRPRAFSIAGLSGDADLPTMTGFIALAASDFERSSGLDESFEGWRCLEEVEFRLRLHVRHQLSYEEIGPSALGSDGGEWRLQLPATDHTVMYTRNREKLLAKLEQWVPLLRARGPRFNDETRARLLYQPERSL
jgi:hypothetical protein